MSVENQKHGLPRVDHLRQAKPQLAFLSVEPLIEDIGTIDLRGISWVIVGGESGARARPMKAEWVVSIQRQCKRVHVPFFFKQWGGVRKSITGRQLAGRTYDELPDVVRNSVPGSDTRKSLLAEFASVWPTDNSLGRSRRSA